MKRFLFGCMLSVFVFIFPLVLMAQDYISQADALYYDALYYQGGIENYQKSIDLCLKAIKANPNSYEAHWKCARGYREYAVTAKKLNVEGWKDICAKYGKEGMKYAHKAIELDPSKADGHYYYGLNVGIYSDGVSMLTALAEGLKGKTQSSLERAYELDKMYDEGEPIVALGRFWAVLPWPFRDREKALRYYREFQKTKYFAQEVEAWLYLGELLLELGGDDNEAEAKALLKKVAKSDEKYFSDWAKRLLRENN